MFKRNLVHQVEAALEAEAVQVHQQNLLNMKMKLNAIMKILVKLNALLVHLKKYQPQKTAHLVNIVLL
jgi:hypothetical protein